MVDLPPSDDGEHVGRLVHHVRQGHAGQLSLDPLGRGDLLEHFADLDRALRDRAAHLLGVPAFGARPLRVGLVVSSAQCAPGAEAQSLVDAHGDDVPLEVALVRGPVALVDGEAPQAMGAGVFVCFRDHPGGDVGCAQIQDAACGDLVVEGLHEFGDGGCPVPPVDVKQVDVGCLQLL